MKRKTGKMILLTGVLCILSLAVCACGKTCEAFVEEQDCDISRNYIPVPCIAIPKSEEIIHLPSTRRIK